jgi:hypothetical protein
VEGGRRRGVQLANAVAAVVDLQDREEVLKGGKVDFSFETESTIDRTQEAYCGLVLDGSRAGTILV